MLTGMAVLRLAVLLVGLLARPGSAATLRDHPIAAGTAPVYLDGPEWTAEWNSKPAAGDAAQPSAATPMAVSVPGDILTDLQRSGALPDPYFNSSWREPSFIAAWNNGTWTYKRTFFFASAAAASGPAAHHQLLVLDGVRMGATITLNGQPLGNATNQFMRYVFPVQLEASNVLEVTFGDCLGIDTGGRFTYSSQIDWAPTMLTKQGGRSTFGFGIWKSVYVVAVPAATAAISQFIPHTFFQGGHPTAIIADGAHAGFEIKASAELWAPAGGAAGTLTVLGTWPGAAAVSAKLTVPAGNSTSSLVIPASQTTGARLWHPNGHGDQVLYNISCTFVPDGVMPTEDGGRVSAVATRALGFRHVALVTTNDTDPAVVSAAAAQNGTGTFTMFFRVNGAAVSARGANKIPMDLLDGRMSAIGHRRLVQSAAEGNMNMLRVWGG